MPRRTLATFVIGLGLMGACGTQLRAQATHATFLGVVRDESGKPVSDASLTLQNVETGWRLTTVSQDNGAYHLPLIPVGRYQLRVVKDGYAEVRLTGYTASVNQNVVVNPVLPPSPCRSTSKFRLRRRSWT